MNIEVVYLSKAHVDSIDYNNIILRIIAKDIFDSDGAGDFWVLSRTLAAGGVNKMMISMRGLDFIDSRGIGTIINVAKVLREKRGDLVLLEVPEHIDRIFKPVNLHRFIKMFATEQEAMNYLKFV